LVFSYLELGSESLTEELLGSSGQNDILRAEKQPMLSIGVGAALGHLCQPFASSTRLELSYFGGLMIAIKHFLLVLLPNIA